MEDVRVAWTIVVVEEWVMGDGGGCGMVDGGDCGRNG